MSRARVERQEEGYNFRRTKWVWRRNRRDIREDTQRGLVDV